MSKPKRVIFCTYPCLYSSVVLSEILRTPQIEVVAIISSTRNLRTNENKLASDLERLKVSGIHYSLYLLLITQGYKFLSALFKQSSVESLCKRNRIPIISTANINTAEVNGEIKKLKPDVLFCAHFNQLVHPSTYGIAKEAAINLHPSLLPDLKGVDPVFYALADNYSTTGVTIHHLAEDFDTGVVINQTKQNITPDETLLSLNNKLFKSGVSLFINHLSDEKTTPYKATISSSERYDSWPSRTDVKKFKQLHNLVLSRNLFK